MKGTKDFIVKEIDGEKVLSSKAEESAGEQIPLTATGALLWDELKQETTREQLMGAILAEYDVNEETAAVVVDTFIEKLEKIHALKNRS